jgi:hypothetical protein
MDLEKAIAVYSSVVIIWVLGMAIYNDYKKEEPEESEKRPIKEPEKKFDKYRIVDHYMNSHKYTNSETIIVLLELERNGHKSEELNDLFNALNHNNCTEREKGELFRELLLKL